MAARVPGIAPLWRILAAGFMALASLGANAAQYDNWVVEENSDGAMASNRNNSGSMIGYACSKTSSECAFFFSPSRANCVNEVKYDLLVATSTHSSARKVVCKRLRNGTLDYAYVFDDLDAMRRRTLEGNGSMGIAQGNTEGGFNIARFDIVGFQSAVDWVNRSVRSYGNGNNNNNSNTYGNNNSNSYGPPPLPEGSYQRTCRAMRMSGDTLVADCQDRSGSYRDTSLQRAYNCRVGIDNDNGQLICNRW